MKKLAKPPKPKDCPYDVYSRECLKMQRTSHEMCQKCPFLNKK